MTVVLKTSAKASCRLRSWNKGSGILSVVLQAGVREILRKRELSVMLTATSTGNPWSLVAKRENLFGGAQKTEEGNTAFGEGARSQQQTAGEARAAQATEA